MSTVPRRAYFVVNPHSGNGKTARDWPSIAERLAAAMGEVAFAFTECPLDATRLTRAALANGYDLIVSVGGDGTMNEVVNGFFSEGRATHPDAALGFISRGTGGDFRRTLGASLDLDEAIERLCNGREQRMDVGLLRYMDHAGDPAERFFFNITSFGFSGVVDHYVNTTSKALGGRLSFMIGTLRGLVHYRNQRVRLFLDDQKPFERTLRMVTCANGRYFGGGMQIAPEAEIGDGLFDIVILGDISRRWLLSKGTRVYSGRHVGLEGVECWRAKRLLAEPLDDTPVLIDMDGEAPGRLPAEFILYEGALWLRG